MFLFKEDILQHIYKYKLYSSTSLRTLSGDDLQIIKTGEKNLNSGPDFLNAQIKIANVLLAGSVEIHINSSDWLKHNHNNDKSYENVILHVVYNNDKPIFINGVVIPTLELKNIVSESLLLKYSELLKNKTFVPCENSISKVPSIIFNSWIDRMLAERMDDKKHFINQIFTNTFNNWEETFYQLLAYTFGFGINKHAFIKTAQTLPLNIIAKHKNNLFQIEALLFGTAGLLNDYLNDDYLIKLQNEYLYLKTKYTLTTFVTKQEWHFSKLHPTNFPAIRLAQFAMLIFKSSHLFSKILEAKDIESIKKMFEVATSEYWSNHYSLDKTSKNKTKNLGSAAIDLIIINAIVPTLYAYSHNNADNRNRANEYLLNLKPENNKIIRAWTDAGINAKDSYSSQALLHLKNNYCDNKKCLQCSIGNYIIKQ